MTPPTTPKKPERRANPLSREQIVHAAIDLLDAAGESGLTFRALSERLATGPGAIYWHVAGKSELLAAATDRVVSIALATGKAGRPGAIHDVALGLFDAIERHPWLAPQITAQLSHNPTGPVTTRIFEDIGRQASALDVPTSSWFTATSALVHYILGAAGQNAANLARARSLGPEADRSAYMDTVAGAWRRLSPEDYPFTRAVADHGLDHDDRAQFLAGIDLIIAGATARPPAEPGSQVKAEPA
ncbi:TetR/AcrR family transcriptional regulator [Streptomyces sp. Amel2xC10]|uniref:TetR/AcrR family transcriptional regulator n=1 Tax=Streptomyces sp. Amel2xC10 TaxID=1305826 RepID=UPI000A089B98|nr:TetR family transcriptional regulator [Streptomyces sp. Amel2xC10]SMF76136.1 transcriptional regulator, TetR family [Streptomyces sp. Amel2xC10]